MSLRSLMFGAAVALLVSVLALVAMRSPLAAAEKNSPDSAVELRFALRLDEAGQAKLYLDMPLTDELVRLLLAGQEKQPTVFLSASKGIHYSEAVRVIDRLGSLGISRISLDTRHEKP
jgi:biopolymer transport protein ExbD